MSGIDEKALEGAQKAYWMDFGDMDPIEAAIREYLRLTALQSGGSEAGKEPIAWESTTVCHIKFVTDSRYRKFSPKARAWYKPYRCSNCARSDAGEAGE